jgi:hypothetical protein
MNSPQNKWLPQREKERLLSETKENHRECVQEKLDFIDDAPTWRDARERVKEVLATAFSRDMRILDTVSIIKRDGKGKKSAENVYAGTAGKRAFPEEISPNAEVLSYVEVNHNPELIIGGNFGEYFPREKNGEVRGIVQEMLLAVKQKIAEVANQEAKKERESL